MPGTRTITIHFEGDVEDARALARAGYALWVASRASGDGFVAVDGSHMTKADGWTGDCKITVEDR